MNEQAEEQYEFEGVDDPSCEAFGVASCDFVDRRSGSPRTTKSHEQTQSSFSDDQTEDQFEFATIEDAIQELRAGRMIVVVDDEDRENEGDLTMAAELITQL